MSIIFFFGGGGAFYAKFQDSWKVASRHCRYPAGQKFCRNYSISLCFRDKHIFCVLRRNSKWPPKVARKQVLEKVTSRFCRYSVGQKFHRNCSISLCFRDKPVFVLNAEIQDGHQKWRENVVLQKKPVDSADTPRVKPLSNSLYFALFQR